MHYVPNARSVIQYNRHGSQIHSTRIISCMSWVSSAWIYRRHQETFGMFWEFKMICLAQSALSRIGECSCNLYIRTCAETNDRIELKQVSRDVQDCLVATSSSNNEGWTKHLFIMELKFMEHVFCPLLSPYIVSIFADLYRFLRHQLISIYWKKMTLFHTDSTILHIQDSV